MKTIPEIISTIERSLAELKAACADSERQLEELKGLAAHPGTSSVDEPTPRMLSGLRDLAPRRYGDDLPVVDPNLGRLS
jgi:hypothetical protein